MANSLYPGFQDSRIYFSLPHAKDFYRSSFLYVPKYSSFIQSKKLPCVFHSGESSLWNASVCCRLAATQSRYQRPRQRKAKQRNKMQEAARRERTLNIGSAKPSEECLSRFLEEQALRLHNKNPTFLSVSEDLDIPIQSVSFISKDHFWGNCGISGVVDSDSCVSSKPNFSMKLLEILSYAKKKGELNDMDLSTLIKSSSFEENLDQMNLQIPAENRYALEEQINLLDLTSKNCIKDHVSNKNKEELDFHSETSDADGQNKLVESILGSEFSNDDDQGKSKKMQVTLKVHNKVSDYSERAVESNNLLQCEPFPLYGDRQSSTSSRHLSKSSGSRSNPSRSSIPGLRSKYSKPDPKAKLPKKCERPPYILPNFEEPNGRSNKSLFNGNNSISITPLDLVDVAQETDDEVDLYWCQLDQVDDQENDLPASIDSVSTCETARPLQSQPLSPLPSMRTATPRSFEYSRKQTQESQEWTDFDCSDSDDEMNLNMEDSDCSDSDDEINLNMEDSDLIIDSITTCEVARPLQCQSLSPLHSNRIDTSRSFVYARKQTKDFPEWTEFEWSESDAELNPSTKESYLIKSSTSGQKMFLEEKNSLDSVARGGHDKENVNLSLKASSILFSERKCKDSLPKGQSLQPSFWYNRKECEYVNNTSYELFLEENKSLTYNELQSLPASVKFLEIPAWKSQIYPNIPFQLQYSYSEVPKAMILGFRDHFSPFGPGTMDRPWTGRPLIKPRRHMDYLKPFDPVLERVKSFELSFNRKLQFTKRVKTREQIQGRPLTEDEVKVLVQNCHAEKSQVNLGRDGLTHNMIHLIHNHWKKHPVCRVKCRGPPTLDMDNLCFHIEDKTGGHIIYRTGCILYVFRGRHYSYKLRPLLPYMLYKPSSPVYPKLVPQAPRGLTIEQARQLRIIGQKVKPLIKLRKNGAYPNLLRRVRDAFMVDNLVVLDCEDLKPEDYRKIGAKLKELVPCVLLSLKSNKVVLWKGTNGRPLTSGSSGLNEEHLLSDISGAKVAYMESYPLGSCGDGSSERSSDSLIYEGAHVGMDSLAESSQPQLLVEKNIELDYQSTRTRIISSSSSPQLKLQSDPSEVSSVSGVLNGVWDFALKEGLAVELNNVELESDLVLQLSSVFAEVAPAQSKYKSRLINIPNLDGAYGTRSQKFTVPFTIRRERRSKRQRLRTRSRSSPKLKRHVDIPFDKVARIFDVKK